MTTPRDGAVALTEDWEFGVLGIYNYRRPGPFTGFYRHITDHHARLEGDICEAGVFRGASLLATALLLKELGSPKLVYGFDTFSGFPPVYDPKDDLTAFDGLLDAGSITAEHHAKVRRNQEHLAVAGRRTTPGQISTSGDFSDTAADQIRAKAEYLGLDNIRLVAGPFEETMSGDANPPALMAALLDCDLYSSYRTALPWIWDRLVPGGYCYLDEYYSLKFPGARIAVDEFFGGRQDGPERHDLEPGDFERWFVRRSEVSS